MIIASSIFFVGNLYYDLRKTAFIFIFLFKQKKEAPRSIKRKKKKTSDFVISIKSKNINYITVYRS